MIRIYDERETNFSHDGIEILDNICTSCISERDLNGIWSIEAEFVRDEDRSSSIQNRRILNVPTPKGDQLFRIVNIKSNKKKIKIFAEHIFFDNRHNFIDDINIVKKTGTNALQHILTKCNYKVNFEGSTNISKVASARLVRKKLVEALIGDKDNSFINRWGGEIDFDNFSFSINDRVGTNRGVEITYGHNMQGFEGEVDEQGIVTRVMPMAFNGLLLPEKYIDSPLINKYAFPKVHVVEMSDIKVKEKEDDEEGFDTEEEAFEAMRVRAAELFSVENIDKPSVNLKINVISLEKTDQYKDEIFERMYIGDTLKVNLQKYGFDVTARIIAEKYDCIGKRYIEIELGEVKQSLLKDVTTMKEKLEEIITNLGDYTWKDFLDASKNQTAQLIEQGIKGSYVVARKNEILIMDNAEVERAKKVIRMNKNGIAFSQTGYNGPFVIGITIDGRINADCITTGTLNANFIRSGRLQSLNGKTWIDMESGTFNFANKMVFDGTNCKFDFSGNDLVDDTDLNNLKTELRNDYQNAKVTIDNTGVIIKEGALQIKNKNNAMVLSGDDKGDLTLKGSVVNGSDSFSTTLQRGGLIFKTFEENVACIRSVSNPDNRSINGISIAMMSKGDFLDLGYTDSDDLSEVSSFYPYIRLAKGHSEAGINGLTLNCETKLMGGKRFQFGDGTDTPGVMYASSSNRIAIMGNEGIALGYRDGNTAKSLLTGSNVDFSEGCKIYGHSGINMGGNRIVNSVSIGNVYKTATRISNINAFLDSGWYSFDSTTEGLPSGGPNWGILIHMKLNDKDFSQIVWGTDNSFRIRWYVNGAYTAYKVW